MQIYYGVLVAIFGLVFGSFLNCTAMRIVRKEDFVKSRSHCMDCGHELGAEDLIPVVSYVIHGGRCKYCGKKISIRYPVTELTFSLLSELLFVFIVLLGIGTEGSSDVIIPIIDASSTAILTFLKYWFLTGCIYVAALTDLESFEIPDGTLIAGLIGWIVGTLLELIAGTVDIKWALHHLAAGFIVGAVMLALALLMDRIVKRESLGGGDIKLYALLGLYLGYAGSYELILLSCILGLIFAGIRKMLIAGASKEFPFGPAIAAAGYILLIAADGVTSLYMDMFL